ncbi:IclR family transcriptional regulator [Saccharopolyspora sp. 6V]|uniref:IclR family transcriptional regulator n=1 Tax=Saccharopolyspora sp. 6V TaxID=2877239 RepID=UPI001CD30ABD|nr:IclR family transcriptional regulator [Saccharopolyspora sp. 6V]MCA1190721.1 IclR family transcriptional regulator [Saccharopolyspora sp. 6V]
MSGENASAVHRAMAILQALGEPASGEAGGLGVVEIARRVGKEKSQVSRALRALEETGMVDRDPETLGYRLGWRVFTMADQAGHQRLLAEAPPVLRRLRTTTNERVYLTVPSGDAALTVLSETPARTVQTTDWVGQRSSLHRSATGRALLLDHRDDELEAMFADAPFDTGGPRAPRDVAGVISRLHEARERGYAVSRDEFEEGLVAAAAPVRDFRGRIVAAVNVSAPTFRLARNLDRAGRLVRDAADRISRAVSGAPPGDRD